MSPRLTSRSSVSRTVTDIGGNASSTSPPKKSTDSTREVSPLGRTMTSSPGLSTPAATVPAYPR